MKKIWVNYFIDVLLGIAFLLCGITGILKLPILFNVIRPSLVMSKIHDISGVMMVILVFIHLVLHWKWIVVMTRRLFKGSPK